MHVRKADRSSDIRWGSDFAGIRNRKMTQCYRRPRHNHKHVWLHSEQQLHCHSLRSWHAGLQPSHNNHKSVAHLRTDMEQSQQCIFKHDFALS